MHTGVYAGLVRQLRMNHRVGAGDYAGDPYGGTDYPASYQPGGGDLSQTAAYQQQQQQANYIGEPKQSAPSGHQEAPYTPPQQAPTPHYGPAPVHVQPTPPPSPLQASMFGKIWPWLAAAAAATIAFLAYKHYKGEKIDTSF